jgi:hypothetical protein
MKILVGCEYSGRVRNELIKRGHDAVSCDFRRSDIPGPHLRTNVLNVLDYGWDMLIAFPPCTYLSNIGSSHHRGSREQLNAIEFVKKLWAARIPRIAIENPRGALNSQWRKPTQIIQPYHYGDPYTKLTCLWLKGLPRLVPENIVPIQGAWVTSNRNQKMRELTFPGIARAMAAQWTPVNTPIAWEFTYNDTLKLRQMI